MQDSLIIGIVLFLLIAALGVYMWLRFQQIETRLNIADSILLDMKMVMQSVSQFPSVPAEPAPAEETTVLHSKPINVVAEMKRDIHNTVNVTKLDDNDGIAINGEVVDLATDLEENMAIYSDNVMPEIGGESIVDTIKKEMAANNDLTIHPMASPVASATDYYSMTLKDLRALAKSRGVTGTGSMNRDRLVAILREKDAEPSQIEYETATFDGFGNGGDDMMGAPIDASIGLSEE